MHLLSRVCIQNFYLIDAIDVEIDRATAVVGPTGAGKSSFADAIQIVLTGANTNRLNLNPSASGKSQRSILEYCLGMTGDPAEGGIPLRKECETVIALVFRDEETAEPLTVGIALSARYGDSREEVLSRFIAPNFAYSVGDAKRRGPSGVTLASWAEIAAHLRKMSPDFEEYRSSAEKFTTDMLRRMRGFHNQAPNARHFLRAFSNALAFKPIFDSTLFVREYVLEPDPLDLDRVRTSIDTWKQLENAIEQIEAKLKRVTRLETRFGSWAETRLKAAEARFVSTSAESRRTAHEYRSALQSLRSRSAELVQTKQALATRRQWITEFDDEIRSKRILADAGDSGARIRHLEGERKFEEREAAIRGERYRKIRNAISLVARLTPVAARLTPGQRRAIDAAGEALRMMPDVVDPAEALQGKGERLQKLMDDIVAADGLDDIMNGLADQLADDLRELQSRVEKIEASIGSSPSAKSLLSTPTARLLGALERKGIEAVPVCDVVEVVEEDWREAVETLLGPGREAVIVSPEALREAYSFAYSDRDSFGGTTLVSTVQTPASRSAVRKGSIMEAISSHNDHAYHFVETRIGSFMKAENDDTLTRMSRGVMRDGKTISGGGLSVRRKLTEFMLGRTARALTGEALRNELGPLLEKLNAARAEVRLLREAARVIGPAIDTIRDGETLFDMEYSSRASKQRLRSLAEEMSKGDTSDAAALLEEIRAIEADRQAHIAEIETDYQPRFEALTRDVARAEAKVGVVRDQLRKAAKERRAAWIVLSSPAQAELAKMRAAGGDMDAHRILKRTRKLISEAERDRDDVMSYLSSLRNDNRTVADQADRDSGREQANAIREFGEYAANWDADVPRLDPDTMIEGYRWTVTERSRLESNELRRHREACLNAGREMRKMLREDLLARLSEKLSKVHQKMEGLNERMSRHHFTGQTYTYTWSVNGRFARMYDLAMRVGTSEEKGMDVEGELDEAIAELDDLISGKDGAAMLADYRQYFTFEIVMSDSQGRRTTMSSRAVKGSGGEAQAPFYVAMAASLAAAYFPGHTDGRPTGMGLAMFDEAFNKLDIVNTQALLNFFTDMGLQLMIAGPEEKRASYTEVLDTIVLVNKSLDGSSVYIDTEHPGVRARQAIGAINPDRLGVEAFRDEKEKGARVS